MSESRFKRAPWLRDVPQLPDDLARLAWSDQPLPPAVELQLALEVRQVMRNIRSARLRYARVANRTDLF